MSKQNRHQRRRRRLNLVQLFKLIVRIGQAMDYVVRLWDWLSGQG